MPKIYINLLCLVNGNDNIIYLTTDLSFCAHSNCEYSGSASYKRTGPFSKTQMESLQILRQQKQQTETIHDVV